MGMYTQFVYHVTIKEENAAHVREVIETLRGLGRERPGPTTLPDHEFFSAPRCDTLLHYAYLDEHNRLVIKTEFKNYDDEIIKFLDWVQPYVKQEPGVQGFYLYEENDRPTYLVVKEPRKVTLTETETHTTWKRGPW